ncbi:sensor histidine kinase [Raineyella sp. W15-4]|uniref:sensor histidine kinase n=1 Tax=Raineyella sp. W15-4 TaxID=3081651 RepID=UPI00295486CA|nr:sensor histidine kinase [Raineyella sp. W15-4]WOQ16050.1 sensor histidine kinase [Raineyella sp. W15-4]
MTDQPRAVAPALRDGTTSGDGLTSGDGTTSAVEQVLRILPLGLLALGLAFSVALRGLIVRDTEMPLILALTGVLVAYRLPLALGRVDLRIRRIGFWLGVPVTLALIVLSPLYGLYAFLAYIEGPVLFRGWQAWASLVVGAALSALSQMGGPRSGFASLGIYLLFLAANLLIAGLMGVLEMRRVRNIGILQRTVRDLRAAEERNALLQEQLLTQAREAGVQDERARLSREIHDTVAQSLVGIITQLEAAEDTADAAEHRARIRRAADTAHDALGEARRAVRALASPRLDSDTLPVALGDLVAQVRGSTGLDARFVLDGSPVPGRWDAGLLRVCQEALTNVARHAAATRVTVTLTYQPDEVRLDIRDDGRGFDPAAPTVGNGLRGMRQRIGELGGSLDLEIAGGCTVSAAVPR